MRHLSLFNLSIAGVVTRFYLMMAVVAISGFLGQFTLATLLGFSVAVSFILGVNTAGPEPEKEARRIDLDTQETTRVAA